MEEDQKRFKKYPSILMQRLFINVKNNAFYNWKNVNTDWLFAPIKEFFCIFKKVSIF